MRDIILHLYYLVMSIYGWFYWKFGRQKEETPISYANQAEQMKAVGIVLICFALMVIGLVFYTNSDVPIWDAAVSAFAWAGMWLMAKRKMENWIYLNISNIISIPLALVQRTIHLCRLDHFLVYSGNLRIF